MPGLDVESGDFGGNWYARDLAYGTDSLIENLAGEMYVCMSEWVEEDVRAGGFDSLLSLALHNVVASYCFFVFCST